jgi:hypothetical protein
MKEDNFGLKLLIGLVAFWWIMETDENKEKIKDQIKEFIQQETEQLKN